jgi:hypothetical protein
MREARVSPSDCLSTAPAPSVGIGVRMQEGRAAPSATHVGESARLGAFALGAFAVGSCRCGDLRIRRLADSQTRRLEEDETPGELRDEGSMECVEIDGKVVGAVCVCVLA